ncbi:uncharacterized protein NPIL_470621 [Nephila pilipes]|uniref:Uncharacterized protein n=1 Tax=Nephila pilipes TaxID=299642 RepID=A0A8X6NTH5_NEPPI|nr:uncharacterized protein NPIL_470621 [Nephila pilipes]
MRGSWLLMFFVIQAGNLVKTLHGSLQGWNEAEEPSCEELRALWNTISQSVRMSEFTNEIPVLPWEIYSYIDNHHQKSGRRKHQKSDHFRTANTLQDIFPSSRLTQSSSASFPATYEQNPSPNQELSGIFHSFHESSPRLADWETTSSFSKPSAAQSGTKKKGGSEMVHSPSWGLPEEVGMFGRFVDFDEDMPVITNSHGIKTSVGEWSEPLYPGMPRELYAKGESCFQVANRHCTTDEQCLCSGQNILRCQHGACKNNHMNVGTFADANEYGMWHDGPLPSSRLGLLKRLRKRSNKFIFM